MNKIIMLAAFLLVSGCAVKTYAPKTDEYEASLPYCTESGMELDCDWKNVSDSWNNATATAFSDNKQGVTEQSAAR
ncbi:hypothetical protein ACXEHT_004905 [Klebsiella variicola]